MEEFNIKDLKINFDISTIIEFINSKKAFEMDFYGNIYALNEASKKTPLVFKTKNDMTFDSTQIQTILETLFGKEYKLQTTATQGQITPVGAWQDIIGLNQDRMTYFDHQTDGVEVFEEKELEDIGWQAISLNIDYRTLCNHLEKECEGVFVYYDNGMHFNGFVILNDIEQAKEKMCEFVRLQIKEKIEKEELFLDELEADEKEALEFFNYKGQ